MLQIRKSKDRGFSQYDWLDSYHSFSFSNYYDPEFMGFGSLRVINEDKVKPGFGFAKHSHNNMEIISYIVSGSLAHKDSMGTGSIIKRGEIQRMSAGNGVEHSEFNESQTESVHFLQIWILPNEKNITPSYEQKTIPQEDNKLILIGSSEKNSNAIMLHQDVKVYVAYMTQNQSLHYDIENNRKAWLQLIKGTILVNDILIEPGDGIAIIEEKSIEIFAQHPAEFLLFDLV